MAGFRTHITLSSLAGAGYGAIGHFYGQIPPTSALVAAGLCGIAGILPDADSRTAQTGREILGFAAAVTPLILADPLRQSGISGDGLILAGGCTFILMRFGMAGILHRYTVHRGMWHSIPAALIAGLITWYLCTSQETMLRLYKAGAVVLGYILHLILDEIYSVQLNRGVPRLKKSFGTAMKIWGPYFRANLAVFAHLAALTFFLFKSPLEASREILHRVTRISSEEKEASHYLPGRADEADPYY